MNNVHLSSPAQPPKEPDLPSPGDAPAAALGKGLSLIIGLGSLSKLKHTVL